MRASEFFNPNGIMMNCGGRNIIGRVEHMTQDPEGLSVTVRCRQDENKNPHITRYDMMYDASAAFHLIPRKVIFNPPATIVYWSDGSKTVVKCCEQDTFDMEKGLSMAIVKRAFGDNFHEKFKWMMDSAEGKERCDPELMNFKKLVADAKTCFNKRKKEDAGNTMFQPLIDMIEKLKSNKNCRTCEYLDIPRQRCMNPVFIGGDGMPGIPLVGYMPNCKSWKERAKDNEQD